MIQPWNTNPKSVGERIKAVRDTRSLETFAEFIGIHKNTLRNYELGHRKPDLDFLMTLCEKCEVLPEWLLFGHRHKKWEEREIDEGRSVRFSDYSGIAEKYVLVPRFESPYFLEEGKLRSRDRQEHQVAFRRSWIEKTMRLSLDGLAAVNVAGDAMEPTLRADDLVLLDQGKTDPLEDAIYACFYNGNLSIKRLQTTPGGGVIIRNDNPRYEPIHLKGEERGLLTVVGLVVWMGRRL